MKEKNANLSPENTEKYRHLREMTNLPLDPLVISDAERALYANQREGTKLVLRSGRHVRIEHPHEQHHHRHAGDRSALQL